MTKKSYIMTSAAILALIMPILGVLAQSGGPPSQEDFQNITKRAATTTKMSINMMGEYWHKNIVPFFKNLNRIIASWWKESAKPFILNFREKIILFLEKEIAI